MTNGTLINVSRYKAVFKHLSSWGFIVAGNEDNNSHSESSSADTLNYLLKKNENKDNIFYQKIDINNIGITGHSHGGIVAINAVTKQNNKNYYKAIYTASTTSKFYVQENQLGLYWSYNASLINIPIFIGN